jgi:curli biogenesis system outer membrane secretion channel CsgG
MLVLSICFFLFVGCVSFPSTAVIITSTDQTQSSQNQNSREYSLDSNIRICGNDIGTRIPSGTSIAMVSIETQEKRLSDYIINELTNVIVNKGTLRVVTRQKIDRLQDELHFNMSGFVSDDTAQSIGNMVGAEIIVIGSITLIGNVYRLNIQTLKTATGEILGAYGYDIIYDDRIKGLVDTTDTNNTSIEIRDNEIINRNSRNVIRLRDLFN